MSIPKYDELMKPLLETIADGETYTKKQVSQKLATRYQLTEEEITQLLPSKRQSIFANRVGWATTYLKNAGLIESPARATLKITDAGKEVLKDNPDKIDRNYLTCYPSFRAFAKIPDPVTQSVKTPVVLQENDDLTPDDRISEAFTEINDALAADLLNEIMTITPHAFETLVVDLLLKMGYGETEYGSHVTPTSGDDGIDGVIMEDKLGFNLIYMQAKQWNTDSTVGKPEIQNFVGAISGLHGNGLFVTTAK